MKTSTALTCALALGACLIPTPAPITPTSQADIQAQQRASTAQSMGYPTKKSAAELEAMIQKQTKDFKLAVKQREGHLESPDPFTIEGVRGICYTIVMRLGDDAAWGPGAEAGLRFDFQSPSGRGAGGPGVAGPGAVASVGCAKATGQITMTMSPLVGRDPIGKGSFKYEIWSHALTAQESKHLDEDEQRQSDESRAFAAQEAAKQHQHEADGCAKCDARYQGCVGAGRSPATCRDEYSSCAFEQAGANYLSACPRPH